MGATASLSPYYPFISVTTIVGCAVACDYCPQGTFKAAYKPTGVDRVLSLAQLERYLESVPARVELHFGGFSEAWLNPACTDMVLWAHHRGHRVTVHTTLKGLSADRIPELAAVPFRLFRVHLPDDRMRLPITDDYVSTLSALRESGIQGVDYVRLIPYGESPQPMDARLAAAIGTRRVFTEYLSDRAGNVIGLGIAPTQWRQGRVRCSFDPTSTRLDHNILLPNGDLVLCCSDWSLSVVIGNLAASSYDDIIEHSAVLKTIRAGLDDDSAMTICRRCALAVNVD
jgi:hypothetical protein